ncbi:hypothetical protein TNCV_4775861 [Trichonephila clavipes]|nr:hypothetical protein TNCV_4775861 [Trichonephila clavipes]
MLPVLGKKAVLEWCMKEGLIGSSYACPKCGKSMELRERTVSYGQVTRTTPELASLYNFQITLLIDSTTAFIRVICQNNLMVIDDEPISLDPRSSDEDDTLDAPTLTSFSHYANVDTLLHF